VTLLLNPPVESREMNKTNGQLSPVPAMQVCRFSIMWIMCCVCYLLWQRNVQFLTVILNFVITPSWA